MSSEHIYHFEHIGDYLAFAGKPAPEHPLFAVVTLSPTKADDAPSKHTSEITVSGDFYVISLKRVLSGEVLYGKTSYDCESGTLVFMAPKQTVSARGVKVESEGIMLLIHPDFVVGHSVHQLLQQCSFFDYAVNEALHLSPSEEVHIQQLMQHIQHEYSSRYDSLSRDVLLSQIATLLHLSERFYRRQFIQRKELSSPIYQRLQTQLHAYYAAEDITQLPALADIAAQLNVSQRYISDALKVETGKTAKEWILLFVLDLAKQRLAQSNASVSTIAYGLGFEYPQYFARLFKQKVGQTPSQYRSACRDCSAPH